MSGACVTPSAVCHLTRDKGLISPKGWPINHVTFKIDRVARIGFFAVVSHMSVLIKIRYLNKQCNILCKLNIYLKFNHGEQNNYNKTKQIFCFNKIILT